MPYHVMIRLQGASGFIAEFDKDPEWIEGSVASPRRQGADILFGGYVLSWDEIAVIHVIYSEKSSKVIIGESEYARADLITARSLLTHQLVNAGDNVTSR